MYKLSLGILLLCLYSCSNDSKSIVEHTTPNNMVINTISPEEALKQVHQNTKSSISIFNHILQNNEALKEENILLSPYSIASAFASLYLGSTGATAQEISEFFHWSGNTPEFHNAYKNMNTQLQNANAQDGFKMFINNHLWLNTVGGLNLLPSYEKESQKYYEQSVSALDFTERTNVEKAINTWINEKTKGKIPFLYKDNLNEELAAILVNTVYFDGKWQNPFEKELTKKENFHTIDNKKVSKEFMQASFYDSAIKYVESEFYTAIQLPYADEATSLLVILPKDNYKEFLQNFSNDHIDAILQAEGKEYYSLKVALPKWKTESDLDILQAMQESSIHTLNNLEVSKMTNASLALGQILHKTIIEVDEYKTEAASTTAMEFMLTSSPMPDQPVNLTFRADKPFFYAIVNKMQHNTLATNSYNLFFLGQLVK